MRSMREAITTVMRVTIALHGKCAQLNTALHAVTLSTTSIALVVMFLADDDNH